MNEDRSLRIQKRIQKLSGELEGIQRQINQLEELEEFLSTFKGFSLDDLRDVFERCQRFDACVDMSDMIAMIELCHDLDLEDLIDQEHPKQPTIDLSDEIENFEEAFEVGILTAFERERTEKFTTYYDSNDFGVRVRYPGVRYVNPLVHLYVVEQAKLQSFTLPPILNLEGAESLPFEEFDVDALRVETEDKGSVLCYYGPLPDDEV